MGATTTPSQGTSSRMATSNLPEESSRSSAPLSVQTAQGGCAEIVLAKSGGIRLRVLYPVDGGGLVESAAMRFNRHIWRDQLTAIRRVIDLALGGEA
jgi:hypothetical protein